MPTGFALNEPYFSRSSRYLRRGKSGPTAAALDLTVLPSFPGLSAPAAPTATAGAGGSLAAATYSYELTATNQNGETLPSAVSTATTVGANGSVALTWTAVAGATGYNVYGRVAGALALLASLGNVTNWNDTGTGAPNAAVTPPIVNSTQTIANAVPGVVRAGDSVYRTANGGVAMLTNAANSGTYLGESEDNYPITLGLGLNVMIGRPDLDSNPVQIDIRTSGEFLKKTTPGDVYTPGAPVYLGIDAQTVTVTASGTSLGKVCNDQNPAGGTFSQNVTGAPGREVVIEIAPPAAV